MPFVPAPNVVECHIRQTYLGQQIENILYFRLEDNPTPVSMLNLASNLATWFTTGPRSRMSSSLFLREVYAVDLTTETSETATFSVTNDPGGPDATDPLPGSVALCVSFRTSGRGRSSRGRNYLSGWGQDAVSGNAFSPTLASATAEDYEELIGGGPFELPAEWVIVSRISEGLPRASALIQPVTAVVLTDINVDSQRRRLAGRGR